jgi:hypothetical protein
MPVHAAIAHLAVIIAPLTAFVALAYALLPASRRGMRWPLVVGAMLSIAAVVWTSEVGGDLLTAMKAGAAARGTTLPAEVTTHAHGSDVLFLGVVALGIAVVALVWWLLRPGRTTSIATFVAAAVLAVAALSTLAATAIVLQQALTAVWTLHPYWK